MRVDNGRKVVALVLMELRMLDNRQFPSIREPYPVTLVLQIVSNKHSRPSSQRKAVSTTLVRQHREGETAKHAQVCDVGLTAVPHLERGLAVKC